MHVTEESLIGDGCYVSLLKPWNMEGRRWNVVSDKT